jgi:hypothetical protein
MPVRRFVVHRHMVKEMAVDAHTYALGPLGELTFTRYGLDAPWMVAVFAPGNWASVDAPMPNEAAIQYIESLRVAALAQMASRQALASLQDFTPKTQH